ncbi:MAG: hypothetical protein ACTS2F_13280 [Thainema sp.]
MLFFDAELAIAPVAPVAPVAILSHSPSMSEALLMPQCCHISPIV